MVTIEKTPVEARKPNEMAPDLARPRSAGPLNPEELAYCIQQNIPLAYDPAGYGWVSATCVDDISPLYVRRSADDEVNALAECGAQFDAEAWCLHAFKGVLADWHGGKISLQQLSDAGWQLPASAIERAQSYEALGAADQVRMFCRFQQQIVSQLSQDELAREQYAHSVFDIKSLQQKYRFRPWNTEDVDRYVELLNNPGIWKYLPEPYPDPLTGADALQLIEISNTLPVHEVRAVLHEGAVIGQIRLQFEGSAVSPGPEVQDAEISYWLGEAYWGHGLMTEILYAFTQLSFQRHALLSLSAWVHADNVGSIKVLEKAGYRYIGDAMSQLAKGSGILVFRTFKPHASG